MEWNNSNIESSKIINCIHIITIPSSIHENSIKQYFKKQYPNYSSQCNTITTLIHSSILLWYLAVGISFNFSRAIWIWVQCPNKSATCLVSIQSRNSVSGIQSLEFNPSTPLCRIVVVRTIKLSNYCGTKILRHKVFPRYYQMTQGDAVYTI